MPHTDPSQRSFLPAGLAAVRANVATSPWTPLPYADFLRFDAARVAQHWTHLHAGQGDRPFPEALAEGWALYHNGEFERAAALGLLQGQAGLALANQATAIYANYLEPREGTRLALFRQVSDRAARQAESEPEDWEALYWQAYALGRYSQGISVARALAQGLGSQVKATLERVIELQPTHADAHVALGAFHAEVIDKVGPLVARMTYGVRADRAMALFERALELQPASGTALMEYARGLLLLEGASAIDRATRLYEQAAELTPADARERLDLELARAGLLD